MSGAVHLLPLHDFMARTGTTLPLPSPLSLKGRRITVGILPVILKVCKRDLRYLILLNFG